MENNKIVSKNFSFYTIPSIDNRKNDNLDVFVTLNNGKTYVASFFTINNIISLMNKWKETGEYSGKYFWASDMIIVERLDHKIMEESIQELLGKGEFKSIFKEI